MQFFAIVAHIRFQDVIDILFLTVIAYHLYLWFQGTKALKALVGLLALGIIYTVAQLWGLFLTTWMFQILWQVLIILLIILFQSEIRQVLERINPFRTFGWRKLAQPEAWIGQFAEGCFRLAKRKIGALIIVERKDNVEEWITGGMSLEGDPGMELLQSVFQKESPLHDGAAVLRKGRIVRVSSYLPLSSKEDLPSMLGTRHRAALGLSERCDAWVVAISEERAEVSLSRDGKLSRITQPDELTQQISEALKAPIPTNVTLLDKFRTFFVHHWRIKLGALSLVSILWLLFAGQQDFEATLHIPLETVNLPSDMEIVQPMNPRIAITIRGLRKDASTMDPDDVDAVLDLTLAGLGREAFRIARHQIMLPNEQVNVVKIEPSEITFEFRDKEQIQKPLPRSSQPQG